MARTLATAGAVLIALQLSSCGTSSRQAEVTAYPPAWPAAVVPDIPLPVRWRVAAQPEPIAVAIGGGLIRHVDLTIEPIDNQAQSAATAVAWMGRQLAQTGWSVAVKTGRFQRASEELQVIERSGRLRLIILSAGPAGER